MPLIADEDTIERILHEDVLNRETLETPKPVSPAKRAARNSERSIVKEREADQPAPKSEPPFAATAAT